MGDRSAYESRRGEFRQRRPTHHCSRCTSVLYESDPVCLECEAARPADGWPQIGRSTDPWLGRAIGDRYLLTRRIGAGASGNVYRAESLTIARQFAVKIIALDAHDSSINAEHIEARLNREIGALGRLRNPHVVSFYDVVPVGDKAVALLMDLIDGRTLESTIVDDGPMELLRACQVLRQIANGVHEAHEAGMIHRDLKPENIMIERLPAGDDFVHILDFGIVWREGDVRVTQGFLGTPLYASPEQAVGGELDRRADIYALGGVFFFMLTGEPPFYDDNVYKVLKAHVSTKPPTLGEAAPKRVFPADVENLVARMLAKSPADRPQTLAEVIETLDELTRMLAEQPRRAATVGAQVSDSQSLDAGPSPSGTGEQSDPHRTVQSEASWAEAGRPQASRTEQGAAARSSERQRQDSHEDDDEADNEWFLSRERDSTGPKAAIFRGRTPSGPVTPIGRADQSSESEAPLEASITGDDAASVSSPGDFADRENLRRSSGMYTIPHAVDASQHGQLRCACGRSQELAVVGDDGHVLVGPAKGGEQFRLELPAKPALTAMSLHGSMLYTGHEDGTVFAWSLDDGESVRIHQNASASPVRSIDCDGRWLLFGTDTGALYLAQIQPGETGQGVQPLRIQSGPAVRSVAVSGRRSVFAVARADGSIGVFDMGSPTSLVHRFSAVDRVEQMAFSGDGYLLAVVFAEKKLALYHVLTGALIMRNDSMVEQPLSVTFDDDDQLVGYCGVDGRIYGWDLHHNLVAHRAD